MIRDGASRQPCGIAAGVLAQVIGIGCCVGPAAAALAGFASAAVAIDAANSLYSQSGWEFKLAGVAAARGPSASPGTRSSWLWWDWRPTWRVRDSDVAIGGLDDAQAILRLPARGRDTGGYLPSFTAATGCEGLP
jgi:hypothetical protein